MRSLGVAPAAPMAPAAPPAATFFHRGIAAAAAGCWLLLLAPLPLLLSGCTSRDLIGSYAPYRIVLQWRTTHCSHTCARVGRWCLV